MIVNNNNNDIDIICTRQVENWHVKRVVYNITYNRCIMVMRSTILVHQCLYFAGNP